MWRPIIILIIFLAGIIIGQQTASIGYSEQDMENEFKRGQQDGIRFVINRKQ